MYRVAFALTPAPNIFKALYLGKGTPCEKILFYIFDSLFRDKLFVISFSELTLEIAETVAM